jgi:hypothetical protein
LKAYAKNFLEEETNQFSVLSLSDCTF